MFSKGTKKQLLAVVSLFIVITTAVTVYVLLAQPPKIDAKVGIFYYVWYNPSWKFSWNTSKIVDQPILGFYNSSDSAIISTHLQWFEELGVDFVVISWWGFYDDYGRFNDEAAKQVLSIAQESGSSVKFALIVEPYNQTGTSYNYAAFTVTSITSSSSPSPRSTTVMTNL
jgi:hypothetical protein